MSGVRRTQGSATHWHAGSVLQALGMASPKPAWRPSTPVLDSILRAASRRRGVPAPQRCVPQQPNPLAVSSLRALALRPVAPTIGKTDVSGGVRRYGQLARDAATHVERWNPGFRRLLGRVSPENLGLAMAYKESTFDPTQVNSGSGAIGLMQILPATAAPFLQSRTLFPELSEDEFAALAGDPEAALLRPDIAMRVGLAYMSELLERHDGNLRLALASYNAGPGNVKKHGGVPPWKETRDYVRLVPQYASRVAEARRDIHA